MKAFATQITNALASANINPYWGVAPATANVPFTVLTIITGTHEWALTGSELFTSYNLQVDNYANTLSDAIDAADRVSAALFALTNSEVNGVTVALTGKSTMSENFEEQSKLHRQTDEYTFDVAGDN